ncbi:MULTISPECIES: 3-phenylpropionate MFS transporter [Tenebrionibacter/Tenebrionicola group]|jgi:PPP family 3-phenylpropionic acid transporter|uniref:3-phenylpropionate MFS transporter n=2 Tax=Tenebrionibacter/Tenebrionicola group TaxID=2969848 RepID=A0A8K0V236_9ENTR|nr:MULTISPECIES: 3-phenylpropionate MFS transporter [Tenebrionibacter/Tenebrionicola group]MBK4716049.1 3-phenylpropionate MFS transporter [Tenebrionibacter intestinalis]MBV5096761.1 3-phenylpropionate MFS transporter [Tenebrionicola larvae]
MVLQSPRWLALGYFTYFFSYGVFLPFWSVWLKGVGLGAEAIGLLLGAGLAARFLGSLLLAPVVKTPAHLVQALRLLALLTLIFTVAFWWGASAAWLLLVMVGFNFFFSPLVPLTDALAGTWQQQINMDYGRVRLWGSLAFVMGSSITGKLETLFGYQVILFVLTAGIAAMLGGMLLRPSVMPRGGALSQESVGWPAWRRLFSENWRLFTCVTLLQGAHAAYYGFSAIYWQKEGYSSTAIGYLWSLGVAAEIVIFAIGHRLFQRWSVRDLLLLSCLCSVVRWGLMGWSAALAWLIVMQVLHCGSFTVCHLAAIRYISARHDSDVIRLQAIYSAVAMGGGMAVMTMFSGYLYQHLENGLFWVMALVALPVLALRP